MRFGMFVFGVMSLTSALLAQPAGPAIAKLQTIPEKLTLSHIRDSRSLIVLGLSAQGEIVDLTSEAKKTAEGPAIALDKEGFVNPVAVGTANVLIQARG